MSDEQLKKKRKTWFNEMLWLSKKLGPKCRHNDSYVKKQKQVLSMWALVQENQNPGNEKGKK